MNKDKKNNSLAMLVRSGSCKPQQLARRFNTRLLLSNISKQLPVLSDPLYFNLIDYLVLTAFTFNFSWIFFCLGGHQMQMS